MEQIEFSETSFLRRIKFRRRGITQKKAYKNLRRDYNLLKILQAEVHHSLPYVLLTGGSGEVVSLDVGQCQKSCTSVPSVMESHIVDFGSAVSKVSPSFMRH